MVGNLNNAYLNCDLSYTKIRSVMVETKAIYVSKVSNHINVNMDRYKETKLRQKQRQYRTSSSSILGIYVLIENWIFSVYQVLFLLLNDPQIEKIDY